MEEDNGEACLSLSLGGFYSHKHNVPHHNNKIQTHECRKRVFGLDLSFTLHPKVEPFSTVDGTRSTTDQEEADVAVTTNSNGFRKKLRLTKEQSSLLEDNFNLHTTLNTAQKQALAQQLNLKPRQVEVWFQNRRARTKLKQTESDCEILKKLCERLSHENKRLKTELHELSSVKSPPQPNFTMCPSCDRR